jgi:hypothetical protein
MPRLGVQIAFQSATACKRLVFSELEKGICGGVQPAVLAAVEWGGVMPTHQSAAKLPNYQGASISSGQRNSTVT